MCRCNENSNNKENKGDEKMTVTDMERVNVDVNKSIIESMNEVKDIRNGKLPKRSYKSMIADIKEELSGESK
jgi:hypothetical protein